MGFTARTLYYDRKVHGSRTYDFPDEPLMDWLGQEDGPLRCHGDGAGVQILRYIPLRRVTFLVRDAAGLPARVIAKSKAEQGLLRATRALVATHQAAARAGWWSCSPCRARCGWTRGDGCSTSRSCPGDPSTRCCPRSAWSKA